MNSSSAPYLRTQQSQATAPRVRTVRKAGGGTRTVQQPSTASTAAPDTETLVNAANLYPLLIESDRIKTIREAQAGTIPGTVTANALNSSTNTFGVYRPSLAARRRDQGDLAHGRERLDAGDRDRGRLPDLDPDQQRSAGIPSAQRITVTQLQEPVLTTTGGPSLGLPLFVGALVLLGFCGLAVIVDNARPAREPRG